MLSHFYQQETIDLSSHYLSWTSLYRFLYVTHAARALQSHDLSGEGINFWSHDIFWPHKPMEGVPCWGITSMLGPPYREHEHEIRCTPLTEPFIPTWRMWKVVGVMLPDICLSGEENPEKIFSRPGIELRPAAWQVSMLPPAPQRWSTPMLNKLIN